MDKASMVEHKVLSMEPVHRTQRLPKQKTCLLQKFGDADRKHTNQVNRLWEKTLQDLVTKSTNQSFYYKVHINHITISVTDKGKFVPYFMRRKKPTRDQNQY